MSPSVTCSTTCDFSDLGLAHCGPRRKYYFFKKPTALSTTRNNLQVEFKYSLWSIALKRLKVIRVNKDRKTTILGLL